MILNAIAEKLKRQSKDDFKGRHFEAWLIVQAVTWYLPFTSATFAKLDNVTLQGTVKLKGYGQSWHSPLPLTQPAGARTHSTFALLRFSVHGDGRTGYRGVECGRDLRPGHGWRRNAGDVELI